MRTKTRLAIYENALFLIETALSNETKVCFGGLCYYLHRKSENVKFYNLTLFPANVDINNFPELLKYKPKNLNGSAFWFDRLRESGMKKRVEILKKVIAEMKLLPEFSV